MEHTLGTDGRLLQDGDKGPLLFSLAEKLLVPVLAKLSNLVPGGGIWLNTQRPEWNDANNALVGYGLSIVTVCQLRRHAALLLRLFDSPESFPCSPATASFLRAIAELLSKEVGISAWSDERRFEVLCSLGRAGEAHRTSVYAGKPGSFLPVPLSEVHHLLQAAIAVLDATILSSRRDDGLYHSYNLLELDGGRAGIARLQLMLEGQVAALSSGCLTGAQALELLRRLRQSELYRADQNSYVLYPDRKLPPFLERNRLDQEEASRSPLIRKLVAHSHRGILAADHEGGLHFAPDLGNSRDLEAALDQLAADPAFEALLPEGRKALLRLWESSFHHRSFLGRSGTMFAFEGLGSIYWHMVSKLLLSVQEARETAGKAGAPDTLLAELADAYYDIRSGLGPAKTPACFGAFTTDPYSHTPRHKGAQQPGMTGQVKEELLARRGELGVRIHDACIHFNPTLLRRSEFLGSPGVFRYVSLEGAEKRIDLPADSLAFTVCQVPVVYSLGGSPGHTLHLCDDSRRTIKGLSLDGSSSTSLFSRDGAIRRIDVQLGQNPSLLSP